MLASFASFMSLFAAALAATGPAPDVEPAEAFEMTAEISWLENGVPRTSTFGSLIELGDGEGALVPDPEGYTSPWLQVKSRETPDGFEISFEICAAAPEPCNLLATPRIRLTPGAPASIEAQGEAVGYRFGFAPAGAGAPESE